jgi:hypothetical protein
MVLEGLGLYNASAADGRSGDDVKLRTRSHTAIASRGIDSWGELWERCGRARAGWDPELRRRLGLERGRERLIRWEIDVLPVWRFETHVLKAVGDIETGRSGVGVVGRGDRGSAGSYGVIKLWAAVSTAIAGWGAVVEGTGITVGRGDGEVRMVVGIVCVWIHQKR